ncbi:Cell fate regulator YlbF, YheA/YmcA/DUF963 family (controls sporulation, competence, biofilm development) [Natronincola peptidivorans]|uniref:UPF0342 protein SAMN05660297_00372 n=1 Tax=Natronincola peptidivorans TaxID=426128 RepID=A0A1H9YRR0_9FIRM|nr:YlbF family regulator [Natronincola peptidivorans]SES71815.1 Cell fate regulator YlbF, YheA/YmcA/DUF963 family (controls sporulation, competence, biofilm development) [Natronincola peptidivorans]
MNVYDDAHQLANSLKGSNQYQDYKKLEKRVKENPQNKTMIEDFRKRQIEIQGLQMMGQEVEESKMKELQNLHNTLMQNPLIAEFIHAEYKLTQMMGDIYKILGDALELDIDGL